MRLQIRQRPDRWLGRALFLGAALAACPATGQSPPVPAPASPPPAPAPNPDPAPTPAAGDETRQLADQVRQLMELSKQQAEANKKLTEQLGDLSKKYDDLHKKVEDKSSQPKPGEGEGDEKLGDDGDGGGASSGGGSEGDSARTGNNQTSSRDVSPGGQPRAESTSRGAETGGGSGGGIRNQATAQGVGNRRLGKVKANVAYDYDRDGFLIETDDSEFQLKVRTLLQVDAHVYQQENQKPVSSGFYIPRARYYFSGRMTKPIEYQVSIERGYSNFDLLNAYLNFDYDRRLNVRVGRYKAPYTYEYYKIPVQDLLVPERSLFNINFQLNRMIGTMAWGQLFDDRVEYAVGYFDGARKGYQTFNNSGDIVAFATFKPFDKTDSFLKNLHVGGSVDYGIENNPINPAVLRTSTQVSSDTIDSTSPTNTGNVPFLAFNSNIKNRGPRELWDLHLAYFYKGLTFLGAWNSGYESWGFTNNSTNVAVPVSGYFAEVAYLLTGETRNNNGLIDPLRPFDIRQGRFGTGAIEPVARFSELALGRQVFTGGLADPNLWTNSAYAVDLGVDWYLNKFTKVYLGWQHAVFGQPVYYRPDEQQKTSDMFWARFQLYF